MVRDQPRADAQSKIKTLSGRFAEILAPADRENQLRAKCKFNCAAVADEATGKTVSDDYIVRTVRTTNSTLNGASVAKILGLILQDEAVEPPAAFVLRSPKGNSLLVLYGLQRGMSPTTTTLRAYTAGAKGLRLSDSTGADMDDYSNLR